MSICSNYLCIIQIVFVEKNMSYNLNVNLNLINCSVHKAYGVYPSSFGSKQKNI